MLGMRLLSAYHLARFGAVGDMPNLNSLDHIVQDLRCQFCDSNRLVSTTDAAGNVTTYSYNADTNVLEWVKYPNNDDTTRTNYEYDDMFRVKKVTASTGLKTLSAQYTYTIGTIEWE